MAVGAASLAAFSEVDSGLDIVEQKTGATGQTLEDMNQTVKDLATEIPTDFETAGAAVGEVNTRFGLTGQGAGQSLREIHQVCGSEQYGCFHLRGQRLRRSECLRTRCLGRRRSAGCHERDRTGNRHRHGYAGLRPADKCGAAKELGLNSQQAAGFMGMVEMSGLDTSAAMMG